MSESPASLSDLASQVLASAKSAGFALMKANYVERHARELPGGKVRGLAPEAREIAVALRDSIWTRFDSLRFHHNLMIRVDGSRQQQLNGMNNSVDGFDAIWGASMHSHYLFDDLVFNAASLFDYLGNSIWFGFHGQNYIKKKWSKVYEAAKRPDLEEGLSLKTRIYGSRTGTLILEAHDALVGDLYGYRSELIHIRADGPDVFSSRFWEESSRSGFRLPLPKAYMRRLRGLVAADAQDQVDMLAGAEHLIRRIGAVTLSLLETLRYDLGWKEGEALTILG